MKYFQVKIKGRGGDVRTMEVAAVDAAAASTIAQRSGRVLSVSQKRHYAWRKNLSAQDRQIFFVRLSAMLASRVGVSDSLKLIRDTFGGKIQEVAGRLLNYVEAGDDLGGAFSKVGAPEFPEATVALIHAGSRSGETWRAIKDAGDLEYQLASVRKGASSGLAMAIGSFIFAGVTIVVSTLYVGPQIMQSSLIAGVSKQGAGVDIGWINLTANVVGYSMASLLVVGLLMWGLASVGRRVAPVVADEAILKIPYYKDLVLARNAYITLYGLSLLVKSGVRTEEALRLAAASAPAGALRRDLYSAMQAVKAGRPWASTLQTFHPTDRAALMSAVDREQIANTLENLARQYRDLYAQRLASFVPLLNLFAALFLSLAGGILFGESILPMLLAAKAILG
jgi:general secretion pathway protein F